MGAGPGVGVTLLPYPFIWRGNGMIKGLLPENLIHTRNPRARRVIRGVVWYNYRMSALPLDQVLLGDCLEQLAALPPASVDLAFATRPTTCSCTANCAAPQQHARGRGGRCRTSLSKDFAAYDAFTRAWLAACRRVLKPTGTLWVIGSYHNIYRAGAILQDLGDRILNDLARVKTNPMPNFRGVRFTNAHETLIWAQRNAGRPTPSITRP